MNLSNKKLNICLVAIMLFLLPSTILAAGFPAMMYGETVAKDKADPGNTAKYIYGGLPGAYAVYNPDLNSTYGFKLSLVADCFNSFYTSSGANPVCFLLGAGADGSGAAGSGRLMTSRTLVGGQVAYELPALYYNGINVIGDVSGNLNYLKYWGKNLSRGVTNPDGATWDLGTGYTFNSKSQFKWGSDQFEKYKTKLASLAAEGTKINAPTDFIGKNTFWLQQYKETGGENLFASSGSDKIAGVAKYPDGQVWVVDAGGANVVIDTPAMINNKGTIIIRGGNLIVNDGVFTTNVIPGDASQPPGRLGIIVLKDSLGHYGDCTFKGNNSKTTVTAMVMCDGTLSTQGNVEMTGSFVARDFHIDYSGLVTFVHDAIFDDNQPPGFRDLNLSSTTETGNR